MKKKQLVLGQKLFIRKEQIGALTAGAQQALAGGSTIGPGCSVTPTVCNCPVTGTSCLTTTTGGSIRTVC
ncbi:class I lanthipeptide [Taibaiella koreensis]|uniref:class I lanthipeptide n=1 Tax=Taibaiella koreensis TaxID=1268548 RepID=UPI0019695EAA